MEINVTQRKKEQEIVDLNQYKRRREQEAAFKRKKSKAYIQLYSYRAIDWFKLILYLFLLSYVLRGCGAFP